MRSKTFEKALIMMNDPTVLEASRVLAQKLAGEQSSAEEKMSKAFRLIICRNASDKELSILKKYYDEQLQLFQQKKLDAMKTLKVGEYPLNEKLDMNISAAMMKVVNTIYNMEEAITKT
jgi:Protein of unknown function (DUF1553)